AVMGHCYEMEGAPPYIPFLEILQATARVTPPEDLREALGDSAPEVAKLMPELRRIFPDIASPLELRPEQERFFMFNGVQAFMGRAARAQPLLLTLEDLHWADEPTLLLLQHMAQRLQEMAVLIVGTYRDVELDVDRPLAAILEELLRRRLAYRLALKRLPESGVSAMMQALSGQDPPEALVDVVYSETEGNPFFVEEVFQHLAEEGKLFDAKGRWRSDLEVSELDVPEGVRLVIGRRLRRVSEECRRVLTTAAMIGRAFSFDLLEVLADADTDTLLDAIDDAERTHLITSVSETPGGTGTRPGEASFTFAHELIRQTLISGLSLPRRQRLHLRVAEALEQVYSHTLDEQAADLAHHLYQAGTASDPEKTVRYLTLAGKQAQRAAAFEDALRHFESALSLNEDRDRQKRADLLYQRGLALRSLDRWEEASSALREAVSAHEEVGDPETVGRICWEIADLLDWHQRWNEALETARRGLAAVGDQASPYRCRLLAQVGCIQSLLGDYSSGDAMITEALGMSQGLDDDRLSGETLMYQAVHKLSHFQHREAAEASLRGAELLRSADALWDLAAVLSFAQANLYFLGRLDEVATIGEELEPLAARVGHQGALLFAMRYRAWRDFLLTGDIASVEKFAGAEIESLLATGVAWASESYRLRGTARFCRGHWGQALEDLQEAERIEPADFTAGGAFGAVFSTMAHIGSGRAALTMLEERRVRLPQLGRTNTWGSWQMLEGVIDGLAGLGERRELASLYPLILGICDSGTMIV
ncbi:MAG: AAA family ATPase, partial [Dehalococcoidia bacterium]